MLVTDDAGQTTADSVEITVNAANALSVAVAGADQTVDEGVDVTLDGSGSTVNEATACLPTGSANQTIKCAVSWKQSAGQRAGRA